MQRLVLAVALLLAAAAERAGNHDKAIAALDRCIGEGRLSIRDAGPR
jgi:hypothetical protein